MGSAIPLPAIAVEVLHRHRAEQDQLRTQFGPDYRIDLDLVFALPDGSPLKPDTVTAKACLVARNAGFPGVGLHSMRHSHGSQLLSAGVPLPTVSQASRPCECRHHRGDLQPPVHEG
jgi:integrase